MTGPTDRIIEIGIIILALDSEGLKMIDSYESLVRPDQKVPKSVLELTGISERELEVAPRFIDIAEQVELLTRDCTIVAHGVIGDYELLRAHFELIGREFLRKTLCSAVMAKENDPTIGAYDLQSLCKLYDIDLSSQHRALADAIACAKLFSRIYLPKKKSFSVLEDLFYKVLSKFHGIALKELTQNIDHSVVVFLYKDSKIVAIEAVDEGAEILLKAILKLKTEDFDRISIKKYPHYLVALIESIALRKRFKPKISLFEPIRTGESIRDTYAQDDFELELQTKFGPQTSLVFRAGKLFSLKKGEAERKVKETKEMRAALLRYLINSRSAKVRSFQLRSLKKLPSS